MPQRDWPIMLLQFINIFGEQRCEVNICPSHSYINTVYTVNLTCSQLITVINLSTYPSSLPFFLCLLLMLFGP